MAPQPNFPFSDGQAFFPSIPTPWLGGMVVPVASTGLVNVGNASLGVTHGLGRVPRFALVLDAWQNANIKQPMPRSAISSGWSTTTAYFNWPSMRYPTLLFFA